MLQQLLDALLHCMWKVQPCIRSPEELLTTWAHYSIRAPYGLYAFSIVLQRLTQCSTANTAIRTSSQSTC